MKVLFTLHSVGGSMVEATNILWGRIATVKNLNEAENLEKQLNERFAGELVLRWIPLDVVCEPEDIFTDFDKFIDEQGYAKDEDEITKGWIGHVKPSEETIKMFAYPYWVKHYQNKEK